MCDTHLRRCAPSPRSRAVRGQGDDSLAAGRRGRPRPLLAVPGFERVSCSGREFRQSAMDFQDEKA
ncbi:hypothetical protein CtCNB1_0222 [Comamonas thiooxydans]|nr:hypothetical protein CtCNB1_0222 [Comamonas thiooxydans]